MVLALACTRLSKLRVMLGLGSSSLRERPREQLFRPVEEMPAEALGVLRRWGRVQEPAFALRFLYASRAGSTYMS